MEDPLPKGETSSGSHHQIGNVDKLSSPPPPETPEQLKARLDADTAKK
jgi:hypothetical protein